MVETVVLSDSMCVGVSNGGPCEGGDSDETVVMREMVMVVGF